MTSDWGSGCIFKAKSYDFYGTGYRKFVPNKLHSLLKTCLFFKFYHRILRFSPKNFLFELHISCMSWYCCWNQFTFSVIGHSVFKKVGGGYSDRYVLV